MSKHSAWTLAAQYLLSPLAAAVEGKKAPYAPTDVERSLDAGCRAPFDPPSAKSQFFTEDLQALTRRSLLRPMG